MDTEDLTERLMQIDALLDDAVHAANRAVDYGEDTDRETERATAVMLATVAQALCCRIVIEPPEKVGSFTVYGDDDDESPDVGPRTDPFYMG